MDFSKLVVQQIEAEGASNSAISSTTTTMRHAATRGATRHCCRWFQGSLVELAKVSPTDAAPLYITVATTIAASWLEFAVFCHFAP